VSDSTTAVAELRRVLEYMPAGPVTERRIEPLLARAWDALAGSSDQAMTGAKLLGRAEDMAWAPPELTFRIERHGGTVNGSTRAEVHTWIINVDQARADCVSTRGIRQLRPRAAVLQVGPLVEEMVSAVAQHQGHPALTWVTDSRVRVNARRLPGLDSGFKRTLAGRRKRFVDALSARLAALGWSQVPAGRYLTYECRVVPRP
jgi:hypothetical protein